MHKNRNQLTGSMYLLAFFSAIGGFLFGYGTGVVAGAMIPVKDEFKLTTLWHEVIVSVTIAAAWLAALIAGPTTNRFGLRIVILSASIIFLIGSLALGLAQGKATLLVGRIIIGLSVGLVSMAVPVYLSESSPTDQRGYITVVNNVFITAGQVISVIVCGSFSSVPNGWRYMLGLGAVPAVLQLSGFAFMPESPRWLMSKGRVAEARQVLSKLRFPDDDIEGEIDAIEAVIVEAKQQKQTSLSDVLKSGPARKALLIGGLLQLFQQIIGINIVIYYSASIITMAGLRDPSLAIWLSAAVSSINFFGTFIGLWLVEKMGRRLLTLISLVGCTGSLFLLGLSFHIANIYSPSVDVHLEDPNDLCKADTCGECNNIPHCGFCFLGDAASDITNSSCIAVDPLQNEISTEGYCSNSTLIENHLATFAYHWCPFRYAWTSVAGLAIYLLFFAPGMGVMPWTINSEIFPGWARSSCTSITTAINWGSNLIVSLTFLTLMESLSKHGAFYMYMCLAAIGTVIFYFILPETKGVPLENVQDLFSGPLISRSQSIQKYRVERQNGNDALLELN